MKKLIIFFMFAIMFATSCSTTRNFSAQGIGFSESRVIAEDKAHLNAVAHASEQNNYTITVDNLQTDTEEGGVTNTKYTRTTRSSSHTTFSGNTFSDKVEKRSGIYKVSTIFKGNAKKGSY